MRVKIWVVATTIPDDEEPCFPAVYGTEAEAEAHADRELRSEWEVNAPIDEETGFAREYPGDWREAQAMIVEELESGGEDGWGRYEITTHDVEVVDLRDPPYDEVVELLDNVSAAFRNRLAQWVSRMRRADYEESKRLVNKARELCDRLLRPDPEPEDD